MDSEGSVSSVQRAARRCQRASERSIDIVHRARLGRARTVRVARNQPRDDRVEDVHFAGREVFERLADAVATLEGSCCDRFVWRGAFSPAILATLKGSRYWRDADDRRTLQEIAS